MIRRRSNLPTPSRWELVIGLIAWLALCGLVAYVVYISMGGYVRM